MALIQAFVTASTVDRDYPHREGNGWIDWGWSSTLLHASRDEVEPVLSIEETDREALQDEIPDVLAEVVGVYHDNGAGTFYAQDAYVDKVTGIHYTYATHFKRVDGDSETLWCPSEDGGLEL